MAEEHPSLQNLASKLHRIPASSTSIGLQRKHVARSESKLTNYNRPALNRGISVAECVLERLQNAQRVK